MRFIFPLFLVFGLVPQAFAAANALAPVSQTLSTSKTMEEFIRKALAQHAFVMNEMLAHAKINGVTQIPKSIYENGVLTLFSDDNSKVTLEAVDPRAGEFKVNGKSFKVWPQDTLAILFQRYEQITAKKISFLRFLTFLPEANAVEITKTRVGIAIAVIGAVYQVVTKILPSECQKFGRSYFQNVNKKYPDVAVKKINSCTAMGNSFEIRDAEGTKTITYSPAILGGEASQGTITETMSTDKGTKTVIYTIDGKLKLSDEDTLSSINVNGTGVDKETLRPAFDKYLYLGNGLIKGVEKCQGCKPNELTEELNRQNTRLEKRGGPAAK